MFQLRCLSFRQEVVAHVVGHRYRGRRRHRCLGGDGDPVHAGAGAARYRALTTARLMMNSHWYSVRLRSPQGCHQRSHPFTVAVSCSPVLVITAGDEAATCTSCRQAGFVKAARLPVSRRRLDTIAQTRLTTSQSRMRQTVQTKLGGGLRLTERCSRAITAIAPACQVS